MRGNKNCHALFGDGFDEFADFNHAYRVQADAGFIEDHQFWVSDERLCDTYSLLHTLAVFADEVVFSAFQADEVNELWDLLFEFLLAHAVHSAVDVEQFSAFEVLWELG